MNNNPLYLLITDAYPSSQNLYANMFVHQRVLGYITSGIHVHVFVCNNSNSSVYHYEYEGITVTVGNSKVLQQYLVTYDYSKLLIHFISDSMMEAITEAEIKTPMIVWIHGHEAMSWFRRWFFFQPADLFARKKSEESQTNVLPKKSFHYYVRKMFKQINHLRYLRHFIQKHPDKMKFVFVSEWMRKVVEADLKISFSSASIIHNPVDTDKFAYIPKTADKRYRILTIRPFKNRKYANDITIRAIGMLSKKSYFPELQFLVAGDGPQFDKLTSPLKGFKNVTLLKRFFDQTEITSLHKDFGVFLCPTRQDAQGVSMCEAMSSGLVCVSSDNTAIPEFLPENAGYRSRNAKDIVSFVDSLVKNPDKFCEMSKNAAVFIRNKCGLFDINRQEIELITR